MHNYDITKGSISPARWNVRRFGAFHHSPWLPPLEDIYHAHPWPSTDHLDPPFNTSMNHLATLPQPWKLTYNFASALSHPPVWGLRLGSGAVRPTHAWRTGRSTAEPYWCHPQRSGWWGPCQRTCEGLVRMVNKMFLCMNWSWMAFPSLVFSDDN